MELSYRLMNPSGNITVLVETPVAPGERRAVAMHLMRLEPLSEQVGFLSNRSHGIRLDMAGGEFCGNATMSAAVCCAMDANLQNGSVPVEVSGEPDTMTVQLERQSDGSYRTTLNMPEPLAIEYRSVTDGERQLPIIRFAGITHIILEGPTPEGEARTIAEQQIQTLCAELGAEALGLQFLDLEQSCLTPLVSVPAAGTLCWESACGSGTAAVGAYLAEKTGAPVELTLEEPGGTLSIHTAPGEALRMSGTVTCLKRGTVEAEILSLK